MHRKFIWVFVFLLSVSYIACKSDKKYHDLALEHTTVSDSTEVVQSVLDFRKKLNNEFKDAKTSPLTARDLKNFQSLEFFPMDTTLRIVAKFEETPNELPFFMPTTTERLPEYRSYGVALFELNGKQFRLTLYRNQQLKLEEEYKNYLFLPFTDLTNGELTYGGGRYIDLSIPDGNEIVIDFNKAYNPYCAYNKKYSCPKVPAENNMDIEIRAGVMAFKK